MSDTNIYTNNFRRNLEKYWSQYYTNWQIPQGYHVHHIKPICLWDVGDPKKHHPKNLVALHPNDHYAIHKNRGDNWIRKSKIWNINGHKWTQDRKDSNKGKNNPNYGNRWTYTNEQLENRINTEGKNNPNYGNRWTYTNEQLENRINTEGKNNPNWKGYYITPFGKFETAKDASNFIDILSIDQITRWCKSYNENTITQQMINKNIFLQKIDNVLGKTLKEIGFGINKS